MKKLICITGQDGAGKSTLIETLSKKLSSVRVAGIWDIMDGHIPNIPFNSKKDVDAYLCELTADARLLFLAHALKHSVEMAQRSNKEIILLNAYHYKYFASELALGADPSLVMSLSSYFPKPDRVISLLIPTGTAVQRKERYSRYECGLVQNPNAHTFEEFQNKTLPFWSHFESQDWIKLDAEHSIEKLTELTLQAIK